MNAIKSKLSISILVAAVVIALGYTGGKWIFVRAFASANLNVRPFIAQAMDYTVVSGQKRISEVEIIARRSDGATEKTGTFYNANGTVKIALRRVDFPDGYTGMIIDSLRAKATGHKPAAMLAGEKDFFFNPPAQCLMGSGETLAGTDTLFGQRAFRVIRQGSPGALVRIVEWRLADFNCAPVQGYVQRRPSAAAEWQTQAGRELTAFSAANPDPKFFTGWEGYNEMKPSDIMSKLAQRSGITPQRCPQCFAGDLKGDMTYFEWN
jgi:hypothetical protein